MIGRRRCCCGACFEPCACFAEGCQLELLISGWKDNASTDCAGIADLTFNGRHVVTLTNITTTEPYGFFCDFELEFDAPVLTKEVGGNCVCKTQPALYRIEGRIQCGGESPDFQINLLLDFYVPVYDENAGCSPSPCTVEPEWEHWGSSTLNLYTGPLNGTPVCDKNYNGPILWTTTPSAATTCGLGLDGSDTAVRTQWLGCAVPDCPDEDKYGGVCPPCYWNHDPYPTTYRDSVFVEFDQTDAQWSDGDACEACTDGTLGGEFELEIGATNVGGSPFVGGVGNGVWCNYGTEFQFCEIPPDDWHTLAIVAELWVGGWRLDPWLDLCRFIPTCDDCDVPGRARPTWWGADVSTDFRWYVHLHFRRWSNNVVDDCGVPTGLIFERIVHYWSETPFTFENRWNVLNQQLRYGNQTFSGRGHFAAGVDCVPLCTAERWGICGWDTVTRGPNGIGTADQPPATLWLRK
jgi:hypothetical protein